MGLTEISSLQTLLHEYSEAALIMPSRKCETLCNIHPLHQSAAAGELRFGEGPAPTRHERRWHLAGLGGELAEPKMNVPFSTHSERMSQAILKFRALWRIEC